MTQPAALDLLRKSDAILCVGSELSETDFWSSDVIIDKNLIRIDIDRGSAGAPAYRRHRHSRRCQSRHSLAIAAALPEATAHGARSRKRWRDSLREADRKADDKLRQMLAKVLAVIRDALPPETIIASDMTQIAYAANEIFPMDHPRTWLHPVGFGTLGFALPAGIGAKFGKPDTPVAVMIGDYGFQYTINELGTAAEHKLPLVILMWNNDALGQIRDDMVSKGIQPNAVTLKNPDFQALAKAYDCAAEKPASLTALAQAIKRALTADRPDPHRDDAAHGAVTMRDAAVIFDVDGVLLDLTPPEEEAFFHPFLALHGLSGLSRDWDNYRIRNDHDIMAEVLERHFGRPPTAQEMDNLTQSYLSHLEAGLSGGELSVVEIPGARELLSALRADGVTIGIATANLIGAAQLRLGSRRALGFCRGIALRCRWRRRQGRNPRPRHCGERFGEEPHRLSWRQSQRCRCRLAQPGPFHRLRPRTGPPRKTGRGRRRDSLRRSRYLLSTHLQHARPDQTQIGNAMTGHSQFALFKTERFWPLFVTQAIGAFNDNAFRFSLSMLLIYDLGTRTGVNAPLLNTLSAGLLILPFFLFSATAGQLADKYDKALLVRRIKFAEIFVMALAAFSLFTDQVWLQLLCVFLTGVQSAFFGPIKYSILPQHLEKHELLGGNGLDRNGHLHIGAARHDVRQRLYHRRDRPPHGRLHHGGLGGHCLADQPPHSIGPGTAARPQDRAEFCARDLARHSPGDRPQGCVPRDPRHFLVLVPGRHLPDPDTRLRARRSFRRRIGRDPRHRHLHGGHRHRIGLHQLAA